MPIHVHNCPIIYIAMQSHWGSRRMYERSCSKRQNSSQAFEFETTPCLRLESCPILATNGNNIPCDMKALNLTCDRDDHWQDRAAYSKLSLGES